NIYKFNNEGKKITKFNSDFMMSAIAETDMKTKVGYINLEKNGVIGYHQAVVPQIMLILHGEGYVRGEEDAYRQVEAGDAIYWEKGEWHETKASDGLIALVIESIEMIPSSSMTLKK